VESFGSGSALAQMTGSAGTAGAGEAVLVSLPASSAPTAAAAPRGESILGGYPAQIQASLRSKGMVMLEVPEPGQPKGTVGALVLFEKPKERTYRMLSQAERQGEFHSELSEVVHIERFEDGQIDEHRIKMMFVKIAYRLRYALDPGKRTIVWGLDDGFDNGVEHISGRWELFDHGEAQTLGRFGTMVRVGKGLPTWLEESVSRKRVPETVEATREWVNSDGRWRP